MPIFIIALLGSVALGAALLWWRGSKMRGRDVSTGMVVARAIGWSLVLCWSLVLVPGHGFAVLPVPAIVPLLIGLFSGPDAWEAAVRFRWQHVGALGLLFSVPHFVVGTTAYIVSARSRRLPLVFAAAGAVVVAFVVGMAIPDRAARISQEPATRVQLTKEPWVLRGRVVDEQGHGVRAPVVLHYLTIHGRPIGRPTGEPGKARKLATISDEDGNYTFTQRVPKIERSDRLLGRAPTEFAVTAYRIGLLDPADIEWARTVPDWREVPPSITTPREYDVGEGEFVFEDIMLQGIAPVPAIAETTDESMPAVPFAGLVAYYAAQQGLVTQVGYYMGTREQLERETNELAALTFCTALDTTFPPSVEHVVSRLNRVDQNFRVRLIGWRSFASEADASWLRGRWLCSAMHIPDEEWRGEHPGWRITQIDPDPSLPPRAVDPARAPRSAAAATGGSWGSGAVAIAPQSPPRRPFPPSFAISDIEFDATQPARSVVIMRNLRVPVGGAVPGAKVVEIRNADSAVLELRGTKYLVQREAESPATPGG